MNYLRLTVLLFAVLTATIIEGNYVLSRGRIESCGGCSLNRLPDVKAFIYDDLQKYDNIYFKKIHGVKPELVVLDDNENEVERIPLTDLNRKQCHDLLIKKGFRLKSDKQIEDL